MKYIKVKDYTYLKDFILIENKYYPKEQYELIQTNNFHQSEYYHKYLNNYKEKEIFYMFSKHCYTILDYVDNLEELCSQYGLLDEERYYQVFNNKQEFYKNVTIYTKCEKINNSYKIKNFIIVFYKSIEEDLKDFIIKTSQDVLNKIFEEEYNINFILIFNPFPKMIKSARSYILN